MTLYAYYNSSVSSPSPVIGFIDTEAFTFPRMPDARNLLPLTQAQWATRTDGFWAVSNGALVPYVPVPSTGSILLYKKRVKAALSSSDATMIRIIEGSALGLTSLTQPDVVAFVNYRRSLRTILNETMPNIALPLPIVPTYPAGT